MSYSQTALDALQRGQLDEFKKAYASALRHDDDDMLYSLAEELYSLGFLNQARRIYEKLLERYPEEDDIRVDLADVLLEDDQNDKALTLLNQVKSDSPAYVRALMVAADLYQTQELFEVSEQKLLEARQLEPEEPAIEFALAELYFTMREFRKAIALYLDLIKQGITQLSAVNLVERLGVAYANAGRFEQAIGYLKQIHPGDMTPDVKFETGFTYLQLKDYKPAIDLLTELKESDPHYTSLYPYLGQALVAENQLEDALKVLQEGLGVDQYNEKLWAYAADIAARLEDEDLTESYLKKGNELDADDLDIVIKLSNLYVKQGRWQDVIDFLTGYVKEDNTDPQIYWNLAVAYVQTEQLELAQRYYQAALPYFMDQADFLKPAVYFFREMGDRETAMKLLRAYVKVVPDDAEMALMLENEELMD
ncbi:tetratricopeptide repeat protein [Secundilactobacillus similis]|uniref:TPR repeat-containing protein n=1 Tax=Secundilactobacillus similis DSM 23365 = JCM 2765 TaxID=1423804 RepID=A0A0R2F1C9_9LACO|nr:tetratricopeptide repeat protein [Secundilactobacillus similis]KRN18572.1 TPR repeat-containing protein [Secundilactobacillus similis DSM 23365 = JCM 2765]